MNKRTARHAAVGLALAAVLMLMWLAPGVGILGADGDRANMMYIGVLATGAIGVVIVRLQPLGLAKVMIAMTLAQTSVTVIALLIGVQDSGVSPVAEIVLLNGFFIGMFLVSAWLFRYSAQQQQPATA